MKFNYKNPILVLILILFICNSVFSQSNPTFTVILDAGHGGKDPGTRHFGHIEKNIALAITLKAGKILEEDASIKVIYTRKTDVFVTLRDRANIANKENADLFVCIHCNANPNPTTTGTEIYVMGMSRANMNFEVSKTENSVIFLEDNYKQSYKGFDPNNPQTLIGLKLIQENNLASSINLSSKIHNNFLNNNIESRGIKQEPLWVLDASVMPGVLIETGFISNLDEANVLESEEGQDSRARAIADAIISYKNEYFGDGSSSINDGGTNIYEKSIVDTASTVKQQLEEKPTLKNTQDTQEAAGIVYKVQLLSSTKEIALTPNNFKGLKEISSIFSNTIYKYLYGETVDLEKAKKMQLEARSVGFLDAFVVAIKEGKMSRVDTVVKNNN